MTKSKDEYGFDGIEKFFYLWFFPSLMDLKI